MSCFLLSAGQLPTLSDQEVNFWWCSISSKHEQIQFVFCMHVQRGNVMRTRAWNWSSMLLKVKLGSSKWYFLKCTELERPKVHLPDFSLINEEMLFKLLFALHVWVNLYYFVNSGLKSLNNYLKQIKCINANPYHWFEAKKWSWAIRDLFHQKPRLLLGFWELNKGIGTKTEMIRSQRYLLLPTEFQLGIESWLSVSETVAKEGDKKSLRCFSLNLYWVLVNWNYDIHWPIRKQSTAFNVHVTLDWRFFLIQNFSNF